MQHRAPYLEALLAYANRNPARLHVPGHKGGAGADAELLAALGAQALSLDIPALTYGIDLGPSPTPFEEAQALAAQAWGAARTWFLINGASQGNLAAGLALAHAGRSVVVQRNVHSSTIDALVLAGLRPSFATPELDDELGIAHCIEPATLDRVLSETPDAIGAWIVSPTYFGAAADVLALVEVAHAHGVPLVADEAWGAHLAFHDALPEHAISCGADLVISSTHKIVGSMTQSAMLHLGTGERITAEVVDRAVTLVESTSPNALLFASLDAARRNAVEHGSRMLETTMSALADARRRLREIPGVAVLDEQIVGRPGVHGYDPLRLAIDVRGLRTSGYELAALLRDAGDIHMELAAENVLVAVFGLGEPSLPECERLVGTLADVAARVGENRHGANVTFAPPPPWGELAMTPREAYLSHQEVVDASDAAGRIAAESLATYPPGIPNVLPGERLTPETLAYIADTLAAGGSLRGASDRRLRTVRVVAE